MKSPTWKLVLHVLILCGTGALTSAYHLIKLQQGGGDPVYAYFFFLIFLEWPLGAFLGGVLSIRLLGLRVPLRAYFGFGLGLGAIFYAAAVTTCLGLADTLGLVVGGLALPVVSVLIVAAYELPRRAGKLPGSGRSG